MGEEIFRQKSIEKTKSPENLSDYVRVANPGVWLLILSIVVLLVGVCIWGIFGHIDRTADVEVRIENGEATCYLDESLLPNAEIGMKIKIADSEGQITGIGEKNEYGYTCTVQTDNMIKDGLYVGKLVLQSYNPISFILN